MLVMRSEHVEGPWHGGGILKGPTPNNDVNLLPLLNQLAKSNPRSLVSALPLCRAPYATTWFEWTDATGKAGCLVESLPEVHDDPDGRGAERAA